MADIQLMDDFGLKLDVTPSPASSFARYFKSLPRLHVVGANLGSLANMTLKDVPLQSAVIGLTIEQPITGNPVGEVNFEAGTSGKIELHREGSLFGDEHFGDQ